MNALSALAMAIFGAAGVVIFFGLLFSLPVMWLWNACLIPATTGLHEIGWLQAWGILILCGLLFKHNTSSKS